MMRDSGPKRKGGPVMLQRKAFVKKSNEDSAPVDGKSVTIRKDFPESWIFDVVEGDELE